MAEPLLIHLDQSEPIRQGFIEIIDIKSGRRVVTVLEVLSPSNKTPGPGRDQYVKKQEELRDGGVSLVEIDLLRAGKAGPVRSLRPHPRGPSHTLRGLCPAGLESVRGRSITASLSACLPAIRIPLDREDRDIALDLQALIDQCYEEGRYDDIDYREDPEPPLAPDDAQWADALLREKGLRG